ncbi:MAG: dehydrogenase [Microthrixaceae bacterium]|nr:dehydrogenase [Microthrixaceae bacterium]
MAEVTNWQLNRAMYYPYEESRPTRQAAAVFDTNKCIGCQTCTIACKTCWTSGQGQEYMLWNNVETKPWGSYPLAWDVRELQLLGPQTWDGDTYTGNTIFEAAPAGERNIAWKPTELDYAYPNRGEDETNVSITTKRYNLKLPHDMWFFYLPRVCNHCTYPACLQGCPRQSIYKRPEDGIVLLDEERCRGYRVCFEACPYKKVFYNHTTKISEKCVFCFPAVEQGIQPRCMRNCIGKIRSFGFLSKPEEVREDNPIDFLVHVRKVGKPLYPQFGLEPNVYYIPPIHVASDDFLTMLFGPGCLDSIAAYKKAMNGEDPELLAALLLAVSTDRIITRFKLVGNRVHAWAENGDQVVDMPLKVPTVERVPFDPDLNVYRYNFT